MRTQSFLPMPALSLLLSCALFPALPSQADPARQPHLPENSLYQLESIWKRDNGKEMRLRELRGRTRVFTLFFSHCDNICPNITGQLKALEREMPADLHARVGFVMVTLDPEADDVETLSAHRKRMGYSPKNWILLRGKPDDTRELANLLGVTYMPKNEDGQIDHNGLIVVIDSEGRIVEKFSGITDHKAFMTLLKKTVASRK
jgi:protein SCO1/2